MSMNPPSPGDLSAEIEQIRRFNRFYTQRIGVLEQIESDLPLPSARLLFEIQSLGGPSSSEISRALDLDPGYVSRLISGLERAGWVEKRPCSEDGRRRLLFLSASGLRLHAQLSARADAHMAEMLGPLDPGGRRRLVEALETVRCLLGEPPSAGPSLREHGPGDLGWVLQRHGEFYGQVYGLDPAFEALVGWILGEFARHQNAQRERLWIAEDRGQRVGSIMLVAEGEDRERGEVARLRLFFVEPHARGRGGGTLLLEAFLDFARRRGYRGVVLSTLESLHSARRLYERQGFEAVERIPHQDWSVPVVEEEWRLAL
ncbi:MAG: helix-turn-helix domain-containing GNAT family N-acetyltransferase [Acidobacteriota bacterium]